MITEDTEQLSFGQRQNFSAKEVLSRSLSVRFAISTGPSLAELWSWLSAVLTGVSDGSSAYQQVATFRLSRIPTALSSTFLELCTMTAQFVLSYFCRVDGLAY